MAGRPERPLCVLSRIAVDIALHPVADITDRLRAADVVVCVASLHGDASEANDAVSVLSDSERERYESIVHPVLRRRFAIGRRILRETLGAATDSVVLSPSLRSRAGEAKDLLVAGQKQVLRCAQDDNARNPIRPDHPVVISLGAHGKPIIVPSPGESYLGFSIAHADDLLLLALRRDGDVGVDVERVRPITQWQRVADRVFGPAERRALDEEVGEGADPASAFLSRWCQVEAQLKAEGSGIAGLDAHRAGERPPGLRVATLHHIPTPRAIVGDARYLGAVALCDRVPCNTRTISIAPSAAMVPTTSPATASIA